MPTKKNRAGVILAAGLGMRFNNGSKNHSVIKPMIKVGGIELLLRTIRSHEIASCNPIIIVTGWQADAIKDQIISQYKGSTELCFVHNNNYKLQNGVSVLCAKHHVGNEFLLTMADHVLDDGIMDLVSKNYPPSDGAILLVDYKLSSILDMDDSTKVYAEENVLKSIGKKIQKFNCIDTGVFIGTKGLMNAIEKIFTQNGNATLSEGVQLLADTGKMKVLDIGDCYWQDVDTPEMLKHAEKLLKQNM